MAFTKKDPFGGKVDYSQYLSWVPIQLPDGRIWYEVPGNPGYAFDPVASNATGNKVLRRNPKNEIARQQTDQQRIEEERLQKQEIIDQQIKSQQPLNQLLPVGAGAAGTILVNQLSPAKVAAEEVLKQGVNTGVNTGIQGGVNAGVQGGVPLPVDPSLASTEAINAGVQGGAIPPTTPGIGITPYLGAAGAALGAYGVYNSTQMQNKRQGALSGALSGAGLGAGLGAAAPLVGLGPLGWGALGLMALGGAGLGGIAGLAAHETTKHRSTRRYGDLANWSNDSDYQALVNQGAQESISGQDTWNPKGDKSQAPIDMLTRSVGVFQQFGPQWAKIAPDKRQAIVKKLVDRDQIYSKQGDYFLKDPQAAEDAYDEVLNPGKKKPAAVPALTPAQAAAQGAKRLPATVTPRGVGILNQNYVR